MTIPMPMPATIEPSKMNAPWLSVSKYYLALSSKRIFRSERQAKFVPSAGQTRKLVSAAAVLPAVLGIISVEIQTKTQIFITRGKRVSTRACIKLITKHEYSFCQTMARWSSSLMIKKINTKTPSMVLLLTRKPESCSHTLLPWSAPFC